MVVDICIAMPFLQGMLLLQHPILSYEYVDVDIPLINDS